MNTAFTKTRENLPIESTSTENTPSTLDVNLTSRARIEEEIGAIDRRIEEIDRRLQEIESGTNPNPDTTQTFSRPKNWDNPKERPVTFKEALDLMGEGHARSMNPERNKILKVDQGQTSLEEKKPTVETEEYYDIKFLEDRMLKVLLLNKNIKSVEINTSSITDSGDLALNLKITIREFPWPKTITINNAIFQNEALSIAISGYVTEPKEIGRKESKIIENALGLVGVNVLKFIEEEKKRKIRRISIEDGRVKIFYS